METQRSTVVITGLSGYVGSQVCLSFLKDGGFKVRGTVRDPHNEAKITPLRKAFGDLFSQLELAPADLMDPESIDKAVDVTILFTSPLHYLESHLKMKTL